MMKLLYAMVMAAFLVSYSSMVHAGQGDLFCTQTVYDAYGHVYLEATLMACVGAMSAPSMPVSYNLKYDGNLTVTNQLSLNNIINVNEGMFIAVGAKNE